MYNLLNSVYIGDLGISKSATESTDDNNENYGIIPYMAPEILQGYDARRSWPEAPPVGRSSTLPFLILRTR